MTLKLLHDALILTLDPGTRRSSTAMCWSATARIEAVAPGDYRGAEAPDRRIDCSNRLIAPGLVNAHTHSQSSTMAGFGDRLSHPAFMWLTQAHTSRRTADEIRLSVLLTAYGLLTCGTTGAIDHFPGQRFTQDDMNAVLSAWSETGMRIALGMRFFDGPFSDIFPSTPLPDDLKSRMGAVEILKPQPVEELSGLMETTIKAWHGKPRLSVFPAPSNPERCTDRALVLCAELAERYDTGIHTHLLETREAGRSRPGAARQDRGRASRRAWRSLGPLVLRAQHLAQRRRHRHHGGARHDGGAQSGKQRPAGHRARARARNAAAWRAACARHRRLERQRQSGAARGDAGGGAGASLARARPFALDHDRRRAEHGDGAAARAPCARTSSARSRRALPRILWCTGSTRRGGFRSTTWSTSSCLPRPARASTP